MNEQLLIFETREEFRKWLTNQCLTSQGVWLKFGKKGGCKTLSAEEALEEALCFGWIDGLINSLDACHYKKYFAPRRKTSKWSQKNKKLTEKLIRTDRMTAHGLRAIEQAKKNGTWDKVQDNAPRPDQIAEFESKVRAHATAYVNYCASSPSVRRQFTGFYFEAKREETRAKRLEKIIGLLEQKKRLM